MYNLNYILSVDSYSRKKSGSGLLFFQVDEQSNLDSNKHRSHATTFDQPGPNTDNVHRDIHVSTRGETFNRRVGDLPW